MDESQKIAEGDVVDHKLFGLGKVKQVNYRGYMSANGPVEGYPVTVSWDDPSRLENTVMSWALRKISSPEVRPFIYWDKQWQPLRESWLAARREVELLCMTFEPSPDLKKLNYAIEAETAAWLKMKDFIETPRV